MTWIIVLRRKGVLLYLLCLRWLLYWESSQRNFFQEGVFEHRGRQTFIYWLIMIVPTKLMVWRYTSISNRARHRGFVWLARQGYFEPLSDFDGHLNPKWLSYVWSFTSKNWLQVVKMFSPSHLDMVYSPNIPARCIISFPSAPEIGTGTICSDRRRLKTWTASSTSSCIWQPKGRASQKDSGDPWRWSLGWLFSPLANCPYRELRRLLLCIIIKYDIIWLYTRLLCKY